jgi:DNA excision repair protein ERCC-2
MNPAASLFPYDTIREEQNKFVQDVYDCVSTSKSIIAHAPTGLGKTAASLAPALAYAIDKKKTIFFLTSRHTQHSIAIETLKLIKEKHNASFGITDIVGKKHMCAQDALDMLSTGQFHEYCKALRDNNQCEFFNNLKKGIIMSSEAKAVVDALKREPLSSAKTVELGKKFQICPYEAATIAAKEASVVITDYYYIFNRQIRESFMRKTDKKLSDSIIIIDEAHNLPERMREMLTKKISTINVDRAIKEAEKFGEIDDKRFLMDLNRIMLKMATMPDKEKLVTKKDLLDGLNSHKMEDVVKSLAVIAEGIRESQKHSYIGSVLEFLLAWMDGDEDGFARIISKKDTPRGQVISVAYQCLDPAVQTSAVMEKAHSVIMMSGTLTPTSMYRDVLGFPEGTMEKEYSNPFPVKNKLALIVTGVTTKFTQRNIKQYQSIAEICINSAYEIPGNVALFFPSYFIMEEIHKLIHGKIAKEIFKEKPEISKEEKQQLLFRFKEAHKLGGVLLAVIGGSFSEGIDLPGDYLNGAVIVGLPLQQPSLYTKRLIQYYDEKYGKGWDYGYILPAFTKAIQSAGRCIRSETDRGVILFLDERYAWDRYYSCFPKDLSPKTTQFYRESIREFFKKTGKINNPES